MQDPPKKNSPEKQLKHSAVLRDELQESQPTIAVEQLTQMLVELKGVEGGQFSRHLLAVNSKGGEQERHNIELLQVRQLLVQIRHVELTRSPKKPEGQASRQELLDSKRKEEVIQLEQFVAMLVQSKHPVTQS